MSDDKRSYPVVPAETFRLMSQLGFVPVYSERDGLHFLEISHYEKCVEQGLISPIQRRQ